MESFGQGATPVGVLKSILDNYPYSVGLFREMLQNSEDAGATIQTFVLDRRIHPFASLSEELAGAQGPAFLAHNNANFNAENWDSIQAVYESSKGSDSAKIGKYGVGFRSVFHITDCPQIISGDVFAMFDPLKAFTGTVGIRRALSSVPAEQLVPFAWFMGQDTNNFEGTIIRCPLRKAQSKISKNVVAPDSLAQLFKEFITNEAKIALLFLRNINKIVLYDISPEGVSTCMLDLTITRSAPTSVGDHSVSSTATVGVEGGDATRWRILLARPSQDDAARALPGKDSGGFLKENKLLPHVGIAAPMDGNKISGRLFTFLPLPLPTGFPVHVHAYFALTQSRQNLRNSQETGLIEGTDDHLLIEWNKLLFERYIPNAWKEFLEIIAQDSATSSNIFAWWPPHQQAGVASGESVYWKSLPSNLFCAVTSSSSVVWPVFRNDTASSTEYLPLDSLITVVQSFDKRTLSALSAVGLKFTCLPQHLVDIVKESSHFPILSPEIAHEALLVKFTPQLRSAAKNDLSCILEYLLSTNNVLNLVDLPLIHATGGELIALSRKGATSSTTYTLLNNTAFGIFGSCDDDAIALQRLPRSVADVLRGMGPAELNVVELTVEKTVLYLSAYPTRMGVDLSSSHISVDVKNWLSRLWIWMDSLPRSYKDKLFEQIRPLYLLPSSAGLRKADLPLFISVGEHPKVISPLMLLGAPFLMATLEERVQRILRLLGLSRSITDIPAILDSLPAPASLSPTPKIPADQCAFLLKRIANYMSASMPTLTSTQASRLRSLPIYPVVEQDTSAPIAYPKVTCNWTGLSDNSVLYSISETTFLPTIAGAVFLQLNKFAPEMVRHLDKATSLSDAALLELAIDNLLHQTPTLQAIVLRYISQHRRDVAPRILDKLRNTPFVVAESGVTRKPGELFASGSPVSGLFLDSPSRQISTVTEIQRLMTQSLAALNLLQDKLTLDVVHEVIAKISIRPQQPESESLSRKLITLMESSDLDFGGLRVSPETKWLPTNQGLCGSTGCRDSTQSPKLFDRVLAVVMEDVILPTSLVKTFQWDKPVPVGVLMRQFEVVIQASGDLLEYVLVLLNELARRDLSGRDIELLVEATGNRRWVPTVDRQLARTADAVFLPPATGSGFTQIYPVDNRTKALLQRLGCSESPSFDEIVTKLDHLSRQGPSTRSVLAALSLLRSIRSDLNADMCDRLFIPNTQDSLSPYATTFYNDIGDNSALVSLQDKFIAHSKVDDELCRTINLKRLGLEHVDLRTIDVDMGETPVVTVRNTLKQYSDKSFATEFLANASDAGATSFSLMSNGFIPEDGNNDRFLSPRMAKFCASPSLVVHNDAVFKDKDFEGISRTGVGGKQQERGKIGRFGLGVLTMFSFAELAIIVSGTQVVFLNPSKFHLPVPNRAMIKLPLERVRKYYPEQLRAIDGLFGFDLHSDQPYHGSIFYIPLRETSHLEGMNEPISTNQWNSQGIEKMIKRFQDDAPSCLLFTQLGLLRGIQRDRSGHQHSLWEYAARRSLPHDFDITSQYAAAKIDITNHLKETDPWLTVRTDIVDNDVREDCRLATSKRHFAGLALPVSDVGSTRRRKFTFFSTLPLPLTTTLPVHVMGSFVLASDRREIRLDKYGGVETLYNSWLLNDVIPALYLFLLEHILERQIDIDDSRLWPGFHSDDDEKSRLIIESFYAKHLHNSDRRVIRSSYDRARYLLPRDVVLLGDEPDAVKAALSALESQDVAFLPPRACKLAIQYSNLRVITPAFLRDEIMEDPDPIHSLNIDHINSIVRYLSPTAEDPTFLLGLRILPLADSTFTEFVLHEGSRENFYIWKPSRVSKLHFAARHFVHHDLRTSDLVKMNLNICHLDGDAIQQFVDEEFQRLSLLNPNDASIWIYDFWQSWPEYHKLGLEERHIDDLPLVPTVAGTTFVSLRECREGPVVLVGGSTEEAELLRDSLSTLGLQVVRPDSEPTPQSLIEILRPSQSLIDILRPRAFPRLSFHRLLDALAALPDLMSIYEAIETLDEQQQHVFASWARRMIPDTSDFPDDLINIAQQLAIWPSLGGAAPHVLWRASELRMLPRGISLGAAGRFMNVPVGEHGPLQQLRVRCIEYEEVFQFLEVPPFLPPDDLVAYKSFISSWLPNLSSPHMSAVRIPNGRSHVVDVETLYARDPLYQQAFGDDTEKFVHARFADIEHLLSKHGLKTESDMNMYIFRICAEALNNGQDTELVARAETLFDAYSFHLPVRVAHDEQEIWHELDGLSFIPRDMSVSRRLPGIEPDEEGDLPIPREITSLPEVVPPMELVRAEFASIAWSQRALFRKQPDRRVLNAHNSLGKPTALQVVQHLIHLAKVNPSTAKQRETLVHDLKETYLYLNRHLVSSQDNDALRRLRDERVFLNVDSDDPNDPSVDWEWESAESIVFEIAETEEVFARPVHRFLKPYERLLELSGVLRIYYPRYTGPAASESEVAMLRSIRAEFNRMRHEGTLTDVVFVTSDHEASSISAPSDGLIAHRAFLAAAGGTFATQFSSDFKEGKAASSTDPVRVPLPDHSRACVELVLDFIYTGEDTVARNAPLDALLDALDLSAYWDVKTLFNAVQKIIIERRLINPETLDKIRDAAVQTVAQTLTTTCADYASLNEEFILRYRRAMEEDDA